MRIIIATPDSSFRLALKMYFGTRDNMEVVAEVTRIGELLRDASTISPDLILLDWNLPDIERYSRSGHQADRGGIPTSNQVKAIVISSLKSIASKPKILVTDNHADDLLAALYAGADGFLYQGEMPSKSFTTLDAIIKSLN